jgi:transcriptional regulator with XRE-family HTH domain
MAARDDLDPLSSMWHWIAYDLRFWREKDGMSLTDLGEHLNLTKKGVSHLEAGRAHLSEGHAETLDTLWNLGRHFRNLVHYAKSGHDPNWFKEHLELEARASELRIYEFGVVPGLLQTEEYARQILVDSGSKDPDGSLKIRLERQKVLNSANPPWLWVILDENVFRRPVLASEKMKVQYAKLSELGKLPRITIQVVPSSVGWYPGVVGSFKIMRVGGQVHTYTEAAEGGRVSTSDVDQFMLRFDQIRSRALPTDLSQQLIESLETSL